MNGYEDATHFELPVLYKGKDTIFSARLVRMGYTYKIFVQVDEQEIIFEPDEERNLRAVVDIEKNKGAIPIELAKLIGEALEDNIRW